jgi:hypothetical protein
VAVDGLQLPWLCGRRRIGCVAVDGSSSYIGGLFSSYAASLKVNILQQSRLTSL